MPETERDAYGRPRSSRSVATGLGSRGSTVRHGHVRPGYWIDYRANHPEYRKRERERGRQRREARRPALPTFTDSLRELVRAEADALGAREFARRAFVVHTTVTRFLASDARDPRSDFIDALIAYFGIYRVSRNFTAQVRSARAAAR